MRIPYIKIIQKNEVFYITKFKAIELKERVNFHFREPYSDTPEKIEKYIEYIEKLKNKGIEINADNEGVQRRLQISRINKIKNYLEQQEDSFFPTSVVLSVDMSKYDQFENLYLDIENNDFGTFELPDDIMFQIVDGQHRLAGLFISNEVLQKDFEISAILLFNATKHTCAKIFSDINGNQAPVNKSGIFDLVDLMETKDENINLIKSLHIICKKLNNDPDSPLFQHIKMLGIGNGAISQAFFIEYLKESLKTLNFDYSNLQTIYSHLFIYLKCFQRIFRTEWPVLEKNEFDKISDYSKYSTYVLNVLHKDLYNNPDQFIDYSNFVLKILKSQLLKTNGFGAIMQLFPYVYNEVKEINPAKYLQVIEKLQFKINWSNDEILIQGTGKKNQKKMTEKMRGILNL